MNIDNLTIGEAKQIIALVGNKAPSADSALSPFNGWKIVVLDRGYVYFGYCTQNGDTLTIEFAKNIRIWGTTKGLGELRTGPTEKTLTDEAGTVIAPMRAVIHAIQVESGWD